MRVPIVSANAFSFRTDMVKRLYTEKRGECKNGANGPERALWVAVHTRQAWIAECWFRGSSV